MKKKYIFLLILILVSCKENNDNFFCLIPIESYYGKYGLINESGDLKADTIYSDIFDANGFHIVKYRKKYDFLSPINLSPKQIYFDEYIPLFFQKNKICVKRNDSIYIYDNKLNLHFSIKADSLLNFDRNKFIIIKNNKKRLVDINGREILPNDFDDFYNFSGEFQLLMLEKNFGAGFFDFESLDSNYIKNYQPNLTVFVKNNKCGIINDEGSVIVDCIYDWIWNYSKELLIVSSENKWGLIDSSGRIVLPVKYQSIGEFNRDLVVRNIHHKFINQNAAVLEKQMMIYDEKKGISENLIRVKLNNKWGFLELTGKQKIIPKYNNANNFSSGLSAVKKNNYWGFIDKNGRTIIPFQYDSVLNFINQIALVKIDSKWGMINKKNEFIIEPRYESVNGFIFGISVATYQNEKCIIDTSGKEYSNDFEEIICLNHNLSTAKKKGKWGVIDHRGNIISTVKYDNPILSQNTKKSFFGLINKDDKFGIINELGEGIVPPIFDRIYNFIRGKAIVKKNSKYGLIDQNGKVLISVVYDKLDRISCYGYKGINANFIYFINKDFEIIRSIPLNTKSSNTNY